MAGYVLKITMENTHPPVWRRVVIPEKITFADLHEIIQVLFGWQDVHLHDFSYLKDYFQVVSSEQDSYYGALHLETETLVDPYLKQYPWIRYTYDFGDTWEHKIVLEKELADFTERHAVLLKLKGDHFMEDSGGIFGAGDSCRIPADEIEINAKLEQLDVPVFEGESETDFREALMGDTFKADTLQEKMMYDAFMKIFAKYLKDCSDSEKLELFREFMNAESSEYAQAEQHESKASKRLDDWRMETEALLSQGQSVQIILQKTPETMADLLMDWHRVNLEDYCRYLGISCRKNAGKKTMASSVADYFTVHPECVLMLFSKAELERLKKYVDALEKNMPCRYEDEPDDDMIGKAVCMGFFRPETVGRESLIHVAADAVSLVKKAYAMNRKSYYQWLNRFDAACAQALIMYGMMDMVHLQLCCERIMKESVDPDDFCRLIYWHGRMNEVFQTGVREDVGEKYVMLPGMELAPVLLIESACADEGFGYKEFADKELAAWKRGFFNAIPEWMEYRDLLIMLGGDMIMDKETEFEWLAEDYVDLVSGTSVTDFLEQLYDTFSEELTVDLSVGLWEKIMYLAVHVPLAGLKGYSRAEYAALTGKSLGEMMIFNEEKLDRRVTKQTMLYQFPAELQLELFEAYENMESGAYMICLDRLLKKYKSNESLQTALGLLKCEQMLIDNPGMAEDMMMYEQLAGRMDGPVYPWDEDVLARMKPEIPTFVREQPKIGRNDPCPCGSGKKYKKCCGRS